MSSLKINFDSVDIPNPQTPEMLRNNIPRDQMCALDIISIFHRKFLIN